MILRGFKNFLKSIKFYFTPLGVLALFVVIALSISLTNISNAIKDLFTDLAKTMENFSVDWSAVGGSIYNSANEANWELAKFLDTEWIGTTLGTALRASGLGETIDAATNAIATCATRILEMVILFLVLFVIGIIAGHVILSFIMRYDIIKDKWWKVLLYCLFDAVLEVGIVVLFVVLIMAWAPFIFIAPILLLILTEALSILGAYLIHGLNKIKFKEAFNVKTIGLSLLTDLILCTVGLALIILIALIFQSGIAIFIGLPLFEILMIVSRLSAETYIVDKMNETKTA